MRENEIAAPTVAAVESGMETEAVSSQSNPTITSVGKQVLFNFRQNQLKELCEVIKRKYEERNNIFRGVLHAGDLYPESDHVITLEEENMIVPYLYLLGFSFQELEIIKSHGVNHVGLFWLINSVLQMEENIPDEQIHDEFKLRMPELFEEVGR